MVQTKYLLVVSLTTSQTIRYVIYNAGNIKRSMLESGACTESGVCSKVEHAPKCSMLEVELLESGVCSKWSCSKVEHAFLEKEFLL